MWQSMLALVQPTSPDPSILSFETWMPSYGIFVKDGVPTPWGEEPPNACSTGSKAAGKPPRLYSDIIKQAGADQPRSDQRGEFVYYGMSVNKSVYDMRVSKNGPRVPKRISRPRIRPFSCPFQPRRRKHYVVWPQTIMNMLSICKPT
jgi:hypothetical protein